MQPRSSLTSSNLPGLDPSGSSKNKKPTISWKDHHWVFPKAAVRVPIRWKSLKQFERPMTNICENMPREANMWLLYHETGFAQKAWNLEDGWYHPTKAFRSLRLRFPEYFSLNFSQDLFACIFSWQSTCVVSFLGRIFLNECALAGLPRDTVKSQIDATVNDEKDSFEHPLGIKGRKR